MSNKIKLHEETVKIQYENGLTVKEIAERHYVHTRTVYRQLQEMGIKIEHPFLREGNRDKLKKMYIDKQYSIKEISKRCKVSPKIVNDAISKFELKKLNPSKGKGVRNE